MYFFNEKKNEVKNIQIIKVDQMIVFYNAMWSIIAHSCIRPFFVEVLLILSVHLQSRVWIPSGRKLAYNS